jgi:hypothetical protein
MISSFTSPSLGNGDFATAGVAPNNAAAVKKIDFKASGPKLGPLFDGAQLIGVISEPWYTRQTYLPES